MPRRSTHHDADAADADAEPPTRREKLVSAAGGFTGLWALTWLGATASMSPSAAVTGGFAVGSVMASSGLTLLWWKTRAMRALVDDEEEEPERTDGLSAADTHKAA